MMLVRAWVGAVVLVSAGALAGPAPDGIELAVSGPPEQLTLDWTGGAPNYRVLRGTGPALSVADLRDVTDGFAWTEEPILPPAGTGLYYLVQETDLATGGFPKAWIHGGDCGTDPPIQVHAYNADTYILRQSLCTNFEGPFLYLLFGEDKVLLEDTGAGGIPVAATVYGIIDQWLLENGRSSIELIVAHSHAHGDHIAGDAQFQGQPNTTVVGTSPAAVQAFFGITTWPQQIVAYDLGGGRVLDVIPIPGHQAAHIALYDRQTGLLLTGDTLYPGRLYIFNSFFAFLLSVQRMVDFVEDRPVVRVLGTHIEMTSTPYVDFPFGATYHPDEHPLELRREHLLELRGGLEAMASSPAIEAHPDFIIWPF